MIRSRCAAHILALASAVTAVPSLANARPVDFLSAGADADAPLGFVSMCQRDQDLCNARLPAHAPVAATIAAPVPIGLPLAFSIRGTAAIATQEFAGPLTARRAGRIQAYDPGNPMRMLKALNREVNRQIVQVSDLSAVGADERWDRPGRVGRPAGDCEDIAIEKRMRLIEAGFPADQLFYAVVYRPNFGLHTVLIARLENGDHVLDSATSRIVRWPKSRYVWLRMQSLDDPMRWTTIAPQDAPNHA